MFQKWKKICNNKCVYFFENFGIPQIPLDLKKNDFTCANSRTYWSSYQNIAIVHGKYLDFLSISCDNSIRINYHLRTNLSTSTFAVNFQVFVQVWPAPRVTAKQTMILYFIAINKKGLKPARNWLRFPPLNWLCMHSPWENGDDHLDMQECSWIQ